MNMTEWIWLIIVALFIIIPTIFLLNGKGVFFVLGWWYLSLSKSDKEKYDTVALCKFFGKIYLIFGILLFPVVIIAKMYNILWLSWLILTVWFVVGIFAVSYSRMSRRFRKNIQESRQLG